MTFDEFVQSAWQDHADRPQDVADRLAKSVAIVEQPDQVPPFARLATHVYGEHLGQWDRGVAILESLRSPRADGHAAATDAIVSGIAALRFAGGDGDLLRTLPPESQVQVLATASSALAGRGEFGRAIASYADALRIALPDLPPKGPASRALAVGGNNLAVALEAKTDRDDRETQGMLAAAEGALKYWKLAGTWLEEERAEYRLSRSRLQAGDGAGAIECARRCIAVCSANAAPAFEQFFAHAALALALRAARDVDGAAAARTQALRHYDGVAPDEKQYCAADLAELGA